MVEIILTALTEQGERAIRAYHKEKLSVVDRLRMSARNVVGERRIISENPLVHVSSIRVQGSDEAAVRKRFDYLQEQLVLLYEKKMFDYGASGKDFVIQVNYG
jgi:hypothetical protein